MKNWTTATIAIAAVLLVVMALAAAQSGDGFTCFSLPSNDPNVCTGNGQCVAQDQCQCNPTFTGDRCNGRTEEGASSGGGEGTANDVGSEQQGPEQQQQQQESGGDQQQEPAAPSSGTEPSSEQGSEQQPQQDTGASSEQGPEQQQEPGPSTSGTESSSSGQGPETTEGSASGTEGSEPSGASTGGSSGSEQPASDVPGAGQEAGSEQQGSESPSSTEGQGTPGEAPSEGSSGSSSGFTCFSLPSNDPNVCSGNGQCVAQDQCQCNPTFTGDRCNGRTAEGASSGGDGTASDLPLVCFSQLATDPQVCTGNGQCVAADTCQCNAGFTGQSCEIAAPSTNPDGTAADVEQLCFSLPASNPLVCTGNGQCVGPNVCQCNEGFTGDRCNGRVQQEESM